MSKAIRQWIRLNRTLLLVLGLILLLFLLLRTQPSTVTSAELDAQLASGRATVIEFYSNY